MFDSYNKVCDTTYQGRHLRLHHASFYKWMLVCLSSLAFYAGSVHAYTQPMGRVQQPGQNAYAYNAPVYNPGIPPSQSTGVGREIEGPAENQESLLVNGLAGVGQVYGDIGDALHIAPPPPIDEGPMSPEEIAHRQRVKQSALRRKNNPTSVIHALGNTVRSGLSAAGHIVDAGTQLLNGKRAIINGGMNITDDAMDALDVGTSTVSQLAQDAANLDLRGGLSHLHQGARYIVDDIKGAGRQVLRSGKNAFKYNYNAGGSLIQAGRDIIEDPTLRKTAEGIVRAVANDVTAGGASIAEGVFDGVQGQSMLTGAARKGLNIARTLGRRITTGQKAQPQDPMFMEQQQPYPPVYAENVQNYQSPNPLYDGEIDMNSSGTPPYNDNSIDMSPQQTMPFDGYRAQQPIAAY